MAKERTDQKHFVVTIIVVGAMFMALLSALAAVTSKNLEFMSLLTSNIIIALLASILFVLEKISDNLEGGA